MLARRGMNGSDRPKVVFGPSTGAPSWQWVGVRSARALEERFAITLIEDFSIVPDAAIVVVVKVQPPGAFVEGVRSRGGKIVYLPIDRYWSPEQIEADAWFLGMCDLVLLHSMALRHRIEAHARRTGFVEHESIYALDQLAGYRTEGFVLWVGACEHLPHVVGWLQRHDLGTGVKLLTNYNNKAARMDAHRRAYSLGLALRFDEGTINGYETILWSEAAQAQLMRECKAAIDIKGTDFNQASKPPTKAQQFISSGIPFGCNLEGSVAQYFRWRGFDVSSADDPDRLFSRGYWQETQDFAPRLRSWTSAAAVRQTFEEAFDALLGPAR